MPSDPDNWVPVLGLLVTLVLLLSLVLVAEVLPTMVLLVTEVLLRVVLMALVLVVVVSNQKRTEGSVAYTASTSPSTAISSITSSSIESMTLVSLDSSSRAASSLAVSEPTTWTI